MNPKAKMTPKTMMIIPRIMIVIRNKDKTLQTVRPRKGKRFNATTSYFTPTAFLILVIEMNSPCFVRML